MKPLLYAFLIFILGVLALSYAVKNTDNQITQLQLPPNQLEIYKQNLFFYSQIPGPGEQI